MADALTGQSTQEDVQTTRDFLGRVAPLSFSGQPALPQVGGGPASLSATASPSVAGSGVLAPPTSFADVAKRVLETPPQEQGGSGGEGPTSDSVGGQGGFPSFSTQSGPFGLSGNPFGITGTIGKEGGTQLGLTIGPGTISPSLRTGNPEVDALANMAAKEGATLAGVPSSVTAALLSALTHAPQAVGLIGSMITALGSPLSLVSLAHAIASMSPTSVFSIQNAVASHNFDPFFSPEEFAAVMAGPGRGPTVGGVQSPTGLPSDAPALGPSGAGFGTGGSVGPTTPALSFADMFSGGLFGGPPQVPTGREDAPPAPPAPPEAPPTEPEGSGNAPGAPAGTDSGGGDASTGPF